MPRHAPRMVVVSITTRDDHSNKRIKSAVHRDVDVTTRDARDAEPQGTPLCGAHSE